ncbi:MAG TPA: PEPxxWA-CTERM sorting domain-containing protein [Caulobacteraceae bacterium]|nr:PEPxxWA-CTERM sorting domain-containing protein [Caulobacteraceae bacterium]
MANRAIMAGLSLAAAAALATTAHAGSVATIWGDSATNGAPLLQEWDLSGNLLDTIYAPNGNNGRGVVQVGNVLYYTSANTNGVYAYNFVTNTDLGTVFTVPGATGLATMAWDGSNFYIGDYSGTNNVYKYSMGGTLLATIPLSQCSSHCDGLEYAHGDLVSNRYDGGFGGANTYDVYDTSGNLLQGAFITGHDTSGNTGIAFDGTNYYVSNIFHQSLSVYDSSGNYLHDITLQTGGNPTLVEDLSVNYTVVLGTPEPATWALMLLGVGGVGAGLRLSRRKAALATTA